MHYLQLESLKTNQWIIAKVSNVERFCSQTAVVHDVFDNCLPSGYTTAL